MPVGWYSFLPELYHQASTDACIKATLLATSCFLAANQLQDAGMLQKARGAYGSALRAVNAAIADPQRSLEDETLASILLLNVLDDIAGNSSFLACSHVYGCAQLIRIRETKGYRTKCSRDLAHSVIIQIQPPLMQGLEVETDLFEQDCISDWLWERSQSSPTSEVATFSLRVRRISRTICRALSEDGDTAEYSARLISLVEDAMCVELAMAEWYKRQDGRWARKSATLRGKDSPFVDYYSDIQVAKVWNYWRVARILLHGVLLDAIDRITTSSYTFGRGLELLRRNSLIIMERMLSGIAASIPFHLQRIDEQGRPTTQVSQRALGGRALMWPLKMMLECRWSTATHRNEAVQALHFIGDVVGVKQAVTYLRQAIERSPSPE